MNKSAVLSGKILDARKAYYNGSSIMGDDEYDLLLEELSSLDPYNPLLTDVGAEPSSEWIKEKHLYPLGSLNKVNSISEFEDWSHKYSKGEILLVEKLDGLSIGAQYENGKLTKAILRGNAIEGENILANFIKMVGVKTIITDGFTGILRGEIILNNDIHRKYFQEYSNPRNAASGICRRLDGIGCERLAVYFYQAVGDLPFKTEVEQFAYFAKNELLTPNQYLCKSVNEAWTIYNKYTTETRDQLNYWIDGLVASCNNLEYQKIMGEVHFRPRSKIALKFPNQFAKTTILGVEWNVGNSGRITPVAWFEPVNLLGSTIEKASIYNIAYIENLGITIGSTVLVCKANEIIPRVEKVISQGNTVIKIPTTCPICSAPVSMNGENLQCTDTSNCPAQLLGRIKNWINTLNVLEWGDKLITRLVESSLVSDVSDLYCLSVEKLSQIERMGNTSAQKCYDELWSHSTVPLQVFIAGLSIPMVGVSTVEMVMKSGIDTLEKLLEVRYEDFLKIKGLGPIKAKSFYNGLRQNKELIQKLLDLGLKMENNSTSHNQITDGVLNGYAVCITGSTTIKRNDLAKLINSNGGVFKSSVSKDCTHLVVADPSKKSKKMDDAVKLGVKVISENELLELIDYA